MDNYIQVTFTALQPGTADILIALLSEQGYEGFEEGEEKLEAFVAEEQFAEDILQAIAGMAQVSYSRQVIENRNWNALWESNFDPVVVDDFVAVRAAFHSPAAGVQHEIVITPKMSFGTGHHATTHMMMQAMRTIAFNETSVLDFGTGTGVLAILAEKLGAASVIAIDYDEWSIVNAAENLENNGCTHVRLEKKDHAGEDGSYDVILANINRNIILDNMEAMTRQLKPGGILLLSGLLTADEEVITASAAACGLTLNQRLERHNWLCLRMS